MTTAYIALGANLASWLGSPAETLVAAVERLEKLGQLTARSSLFSTEPMGIADQPRFVNAVVALETGLSARALLDNLLGIEREFGRDRSMGIANGPRSLDLDLLLLGDLVIQAAGMEIPHPRLAERAFVLVPLNEIASNLVVVTQRRTVKELLHGLRRGVPTESDAVLPLQHPQWNPGPCGHGGVRADACDAHGDR
jgi:2-amino-4-hydroxy-6-hydroxymethyldihydropteridine diphosphokinase